jgi:hypothetical protein
MNGKEIPSCLTTGLMAAFAATLAGVLAAYASQQSRAD